MTQAINEAATIIASHWKAGSKLDALPEASRPRTLAEGYSAQSRLAVVMDSPVRGYKIAATAEKGQRHIGVDAPIAGRIFASQMRTNAQTCSMRGNAMRVAECEFVFVLGEDLPPRAQPYSEADVLEAIAELRPGLELPDSRFDDFASAGAEQLAADNACAHLFVLGEATSEAWKDVDLAQHATSLLCNGDVVTEGHGADVLGHPLTALAWIANNHSVQGFSLRAGEFVTTGVSGAPSPISAGDTITADLGRFGRVSTTLTD